MAYCKWHQVYFSPQGLSKQHVHCPSPCCHHIKEGVRLTYFITAEQMERLRGIFKTKVQKKLPGHLITHEYIIEELCDDFGTVTTTVQFMLLRLTYIVLDSYSMKRCKEYALFKCFTYVISHKCFTAFLALP
jgi:hypothetical protein